MTEMVRWRHALAVLCLPALVVLGACSDSDSESALCESIGDLESDLQGLREVDVAEDGLDSLTTQLEAVQSSFDDVEQEATNALGADISAVQTAIGGVEEIVQQNAGAPPAQVAPQAVDAVAALESAIEGLIQAAEDEECN